MVHVGVRMAASHIVYGHPNQLLSKDDKTVGLEKFFAALVDHLPQWHALDEARDELNPELTAGKLRDVKGGDIALRGVGIAIFARGFLYCVTHV